MYAAPDPSRPSAELRKFVQVLLGAKIRDNYRSAEQSHSAAAR